MDTLVLSARSLGLKARVAPLRTERLARTPLMADTFQYQVDIR